MYDAEPTREVREGEGIPAGQGHHERAKELGIAARWMGGKQPAARSNVALEIRLGPRVDAREPRPEFGRCGGIRPLYAVGEVYRMRLRAYALPGHRWALALKR